MPSAEGEVDAWRWLGIEQAHVRGCAVLGFCRDIGWGLWADLWTAGAAEEFGDVGSVGGRGGEGPTGLGLDAAVRCLDQKMRGSNLLEGSNSAATDGP